MEDVAASRATAQLGIKAVNSVIGTFRYGGTIIRNLFTRGALAAQMEILGDAGISAAVRVSVPGALEAQAAAEASAAAQAIARAAEIARKSAEEAAKICIVTKGCGLD